MQYVQVLHPISSIVVFVITFVLWRRTHRTISEIAQEFDAKYLIHFDIDSVSYREANSPNFFRGNCHGEVRVYEARGKGDSRQAYLIFQHEFKSSYPNHYPISSDNMSERTFAEQYNRRVAEELARLFYDAPAADQMF